MSAQRKPFAPGVIEGPEQEQERFYDDSFPLSGKEFVQVLALVLGCCALGGLAVGLIAGWLA